MLTWLSQNKWVALGTAVAGVVLGTITYNINKKKTPKPKKVKKTRKAKSAKGKKVERAA